MRVGMNDAVEESHGRTRNARAGTAYGERWTRYEKDGVFRTDYRWLKVIDVDNVGFEGVDDGCCVLGGSGRVDGEF
jgi:hypothetical protein